MQNSLNESNAGLFVCNIYTNLIGKCFFKHEIAIFTNLKRIIPILLLLVISVNHLNIVDAVMHFNTRCHAANDKAQKDYPADEETEKNAQEKEKSEEQEKYYAGHNYQLTNRFHLSANHRFVCYSTLLNKHPYQDDDIQPPKAV
jgi:hypothetical protein